MQEAPGWRVVLRQVLLVIEREDGKLVESVGVVRVCGTLWVFVRVTCWEAVEPTVVVAGQEEGDRTLETSKPAKTVAVQGTERGELDLEVEEKLMVPCMGPGETGA